MMLNFGATHSGDIQQTSPSPTGDTMDKITFDRHLVCLV